MNMIEVYNATYEDFPPIEGEIHFYYGKPRHGKTYTGTLNVIKALCEGRVVYSTWKIDWEGFDERNLWQKRLWAALGLKRSFNRFDVRNWHHWDINAAGYTHQQFIKDFAKITDAEVHIDEAQNAIAAYLLTHIPEDLMKAITQTGHFHRSLHIYSQRTMSVHIQLRGNTHFFHKIEKVSDGSGLIGRIIPYFSRPVFMETVFEKIVSDGTPDETRVMEFDEETGRSIETNVYKFAESQMQYRLNPEVANRYDSHYLRGNTPPSQNLYAQIIHIPYLQNFKRNAMKDMSKVERVTTLEEYFNAKKKGMQAQKTNT